MTPSRKYRYLTRPVVRAYVAVFAALLLLIGGGIWLRQRQTADTALTPRQKAAVQQERERQADTTAHRYARREYTEAQLLALPLERTPFDPNTADSLTLLRHALPTYVVFRTLRYRQKGGQWHTADHYAAFTQLPDAAIDRIFPFISLPHRDEVRRHNKYWEDFDTTFVRQEKFDTLTVLDLNTVDSLTLLHVPGIAEGRARQILSYRERLGGFTDVAQLEEINHFPPALTEWFRVEPHPAVRKLHINRATFQELCRHPYLDYEQTKKIMNYRRAHGDIPDLAALAYVLDVDEAALARLAPYLDF